MKRDDLFSQQAREYATFRPRYPGAVYDAVYKRVRSFDNAWDCATGNGQVALELAARFKAVEATDTSARQIEQALELPNVQFRIGTAEKTDFPNAAFDLITVAQAVHWFNLDDFYTEARRVGKSGACLAVWGYSLNTFPDDLFLTKQLEDFYRHTVGPFWDPARRLLEQHYRTLPFLFKETEDVALSMEFNWNRDHLHGYLTSWSATQSYIRKNGYNPATGFMQTVAWPPDITKKVTFPLFLKTGII